MFTTHVGSFPLPYSLENVERAFLDMLELEIDAPPAPQLRDFISMYLDPLVEAGALASRGARYELLDASAIYSAIPALPEEMSRVARLAGERRPKFLRAPLTGPFTLASYIVVEGREGTRRRDLVLGPLADYVARIAGELSRLGYDMVCLDEPFLSTMVGARKILFGYSEEDLGGVVERVCERAGGLCAIHVCGRISKLLAKILLECEGLKVLDHEFKDSPENLGVYSEEELESADKHVALGCVSSKSPTVESLEEVVELVRAGIDRFGTRLMFLKPDCGFRGLSGLFSDPEDAYRVSLKKLEIVAKVRKAVERSH